MPKPIIRPFAFNDETVENTYGFSILTAGIDLTRFTKNPVMLSDHYNSNWNVIGKWLDVKKDKSILSGLPDFDTEDTDAASIAGKVERGYINACSMGIIFERDDFALIGDKVVLTKCELVEVSIVPVPSNANAVRLMHADGKIMDEKEIQELSLSVIPGIKNPDLNLNIDNMKKIVLSIATLMALGYKDQPNDGLDVSDVETKVLGLSTKVESLTTENETLKLAAKTAKEAQEKEIKTRVETKVDLAITKGQILADEKEEMVSLGITSEKALDKVIGSIPEKKNFSGGIKVALAAGAVDVKTMEDFQKLPLDAQLSFKTDNAEEYKQLVESIK
ncbi:HK97 family phage prohead protease [Flavobacterium psychroterrae]|uniref:HK97 family phage prohead protease n=1 Tax=Flavobacterium psychroterrae TaxID=2133767 RepID=A0ABS5PKK0_9FLAO|nr:HK97 family phage prohead protease [Flavobacterium psychroterrae]MBS7234218.1 HK97 family phage prohead protease [Flavobacterium psychroterrae]